MPGLLPHASGAVKRGIAYSPSRHMGTRLSVDPSTVTIDNRYYDDIHDHWWSTGEGPVAGLHAMNFRARADYAANTRNSEASWYHRGT